MLTFVTLFFRALCIPAPIPPHDRFLKSSPTFSTRRSRSLTDGDETSVDSDFDDSSFNSDPILGVRINDRIEVRIDARIGWFDSTYFSTQCTPPDLLQYCLSSMQ